MIDMSLVQKYARTVYGLTHIYWTVVTDEEIQLNGIQGRLLIPKEVYSNEEYMKNMIKEYKKRKNKI